MTCNGSSGAPARRMRDDAGLRPAVAPAERRSDTAAPGPGGLRRRLGTCLRPGPGAPCRSRPRRAGRGAVPGLGPVLAGLAAVAFGPAGLADVPGQALAEVTGTATYLDRAMVPPGAELTVVLRDVSSADAPAEVLAATTRAIDGAPPYRFVLRYDPAVIDARHTYAVRARVTLGERLVMTTDTVAPVITRGAPREVALVMHRVPGRPAGGEGEQARSALDLPASFTGTLPAASGPGIDWHLDLWPDGVFHLRQDYLGSGGTSADIGRWHREPRRGAVVLRGGREAPVFLAVTEGGDLRLMDRRGAPIESDLPYTLAAGPLDPAELALPLTGMVRDMADAARFEECLTGRGYPLAMEGASPEMERAYIRLEGVAPGAPVLAVLEGRLAERPAMEGPDRMHVVVERFARLQPDRTCAGQAGAQLTDTYWRLLEIAGAPVDVADGRREPHLILRTTEPPDFRATVGCNTLRGGYALDGRALTLGLANAAMTMMACRAPLATREQALKTALAGVAAWRVDGDRLALLDGDGAVLLAAEAVHFR